MSTVSERMRKRKAFADSELDSSSGNLMAMTFSQTMMIASNFRNIQQQHQTNLSPALNFATSSPEAFQSQSSHSPIDYSENYFDFCRTRSTEGNQFTSPSPPTSQQTIGTATATKSNFNRAKPKISFSIESIIGIK